MPLGGKGATIASLFTAGCFITSHLAEQREQRILNERIQERIRRDQKLLPGITIEKALKESTVSCFMEIEIGPPDQVVKTGRVEFALFNSITPTTSENFRLLCRNECRPGKRTENYRPGKAYGYARREAKFFRVEKDFCAQCGMKPYDNSVSYKFNMLGAYFNDETFALTHTEPGLLSMANKGPDTNGSQFFITLNGGLNQLDGKHCIFGKVTKGLDFVKSFEVFGHV